MPKNININIINLFPLLFNDNPFLIISTKSIIKVIIDHIRKHSAQNKNILRVSSSAEIL